jgi:hypothetical protein
MENRVEPAEIIQAIVAAGSLALSTTTLLVARLDRQKDVASSHDARPALLDLERLLMSWARDSRTTNDVIKAYVDGEAELDAVLHAVDTQASNFFGEEIPRDADWETYRGQNKRRRENLAQFLRIYVPEFQKEFETAAANRYGLLYEIKYSYPRSYPRFHPRSFRPELMEALGRSSRDLENAVEQLQAFIRATFPPMPPR